MATPTYEEITGATAAPSYDEITAAHKSDTPSYEDIVAAPSEAPQAQDPVQQAIPHKEGSPEWEVAFTADQVRRNRSVGEKTLAGVKTVLTPSTYVEAAKGAGKFVAGLAMAPIDFGRASLNTAIAAGADTLGNDQVAVDAARKAEQLKAEAILSAQNSEQSVRNIARVANNFVGSGKVREIRGTPTTVPAAADPMMNPEVDPSEYLSKDVTERADFAQRVEHARNLRQIASGTPLDTGVVSALTPNGGKPLSETSGPQALEQMGAEPVRPLAVETKSAATDPLNVALAVAPMLPGARTVTGGGAELAGKALQTPMKGLTAIGGRLGGTARAVAGGIGGAEAVHLAATGALHPGAGLTAVGIALGAKIGQKLGRVLEAQGAEFRTGIPGRYAKAAAAAEDAGRSAFVPNAARLAGNAAVQGLATAYSFAPINAALSEGDPEAFVQSEAGAAAFSLINPHAKASLRGIDQALQMRLSEQDGGRHYTDNPAYATHDTITAAFDPNARAEMNRIRSNLFHGTGTDVLVVDGTTFAAADGTDVGQNARGKISNDGQTVYLNADALQAGEDVGQKTTDTAKHEAGHAVVKAIAEISQEADSRGLMSAIAERLTPEQKAELAKSYWDALEKSTPGVTDANRAQVRAGIEQTYPMDTIMEENLAEITRSILRGDDISKFSLPKPLSETITDTAARLMEATGMSPKIDPNARLAFKARMVKEAARRMRDTLYEVGKTARRNRAAEPSTLQMVRDLRQRLDGIPEPTPDMPASKAADLAAQRAEIQSRIDAALKIFQIDQAVAPAQTTTPSAKEAATIRNDTRAALIALGHKPAEVNQWIQTAQDQHGEPFASAEGMIKAALTVRSGGQVTPGKYGVKSPQTPIEPVLAPVNKTFTDEMGVTRTVKGVAADQTPHVGDIVVTREGEIRRIATEPKGDTIDTARPIDPLNARGTKTHKAGDYTVLEHDALPDQPATAETPATPSSTTPEPSLRVVPFGNTGRFQIVDVAGNPLSKNTYGSEAAANQAIRQQGKRIPMPTNPAGVPDILDHIEEMGGIANGEGADDKAYLELHKRGYGALLKGTEAPEDIAKALQDNYGIGDGTVTGLWPMIENAIQARESLSKQIAAEEAQQKAAAKQQPTDEGQIPSPPSDEPVPPVNATAVEIAGEGDAPAPGTSRSVPAIPTRQEVDTVVANAEAAAIAAEKNGLTKKDGTPNVAAVARVKNAKVNALMDAMEARGDTGGLHRTTNEAGDEIIRGEFDPENPFHAALAELGEPMTAEDAAKVTQAQENRGNVLFVRYRSAKSSAEGEGGEGTLKTGMGHRRGEYSEDDAPNRTQGTIQHKAVIPVETQFRGRLETIFFALDNLLHNAESIREHLASHGRAFPYPDAATLVGDAKAYADNHAHGWKGDGSGMMKGFADDPFFTADPNYKPTIIPPERFNVLNMLMQSEKAGKLADRIADVAKKQENVGKAKNDKERAQRQGVLNRAVQRMHASEEAANLARENNPWVDEDTGETNRLRMQLKAEGFDTTDRLKSPFENLAPQHILELSEAPIEMQPGDIPSVRPHGFDIPASELAPMADLNSKAVSANFMPETAGAEKERMVLAALRDHKTGKISTGLTHGLASSDDVDPGAKAHNIGFITSRGRYVTAKQAARITGGASGSEEMAFFLRDPEIFKEEVENRMMDGMSKEDAEKSLNAELQKRERLEAIGQSIGVLAEFNRANQMFLPDTAGAENASDKVKERAAKLWKEKGTDSPFFRKWFGKSSVTDESGKPLRVYHGTTEDFAEFKTTTENQSPGHWGERDGFFFTESPDLASYYASNYRSGKKTDISGQSKGANVKPVFLRMENPYVFDAKGEFQYSPAIQDAIREAKTNGHDGVIFRNWPDLASAPKGDQFMVFRPEQIKSATGNQGTFDPQSPDIRFMPDLAEVPADREILSDEEKRPTYNRTFVDARGLMRVAPQNNRLTTQDGVRYMPEDSGKPMPEGFYSQLQRTLEAKMPNSAPAAQVLAIARGGAKPEELKWSDIDGVVKRIAEENGGKVPKEKLLDYLKTDGAVRFKEVTFGAEDQLNEADRLTILQGQLFDESNTANASRGEEIETEIQDISRQLAVLEAEGIHPTDASQSENTPKFSQYTLPGGKNYREIVLTMEDRNSEKRQRLNELIKTRGWTDAQRAEARQLETELGGIVSEQPNYTSSHYRDAGNYVAHMRLADHVDAQGREGTLIEEEQSDRHQKGREQGYRGDPVPPKYHVAKADAVPNMWKVVDSEGRAVNFGNTEAEAQTFADAHNELPSSQGIPDAPLRKNWHEYLFRRALQDAVATGKEWIGWTTGETQAERYDLSKQVDRIEYGGNSEELIAYKNGKQIMRETVPANELTDHIGKDAAKEVARQINENPNELATLEGDQLKVGGHGMAGFYDKILPEYVSKYVKKWGAKVEKAPLPVAANTAEEAVRSAGDDFDPDQFPIDDEDNVTDTRRKAVDVWKVDITPEMREAVKAGQPMFMPDTESIAALREFEKNRWISNPARGGIEASMRRMMQLRTLDHGDPENYVLRIVPTDALKPTQEGDDYLNDSSRETARKIKAGEALESRYQDLLPVIANAKGEIEDGNHRHAAAVLNGHTTMAAMVPKRSKLAREGEKFMPDDRPEAIKEAAIKIPQGETYTAPTHMQALLIAEKDHPDIFDPKALYYEGFVTNDGKFLDREAALKRAEELGQIKPGTAGLRSNPQAMEARKFQANLPPAAKPSAKERAKARLAARQKD